MAIGRGFRVLTAYDLILLPNCCHLFDAPPNQALLRRLAPSLRPGGRMAIIDVLPGKTPGLARSVSLYALALMIRTDTGGVHGEADYRDCSRRPVWAGWCAGMRRRTPRSR